MKKGNQIVLAGAGTVIGTMAIIRATSVALRLFIAFGMVFATAFLFTVTHSEKKPSLN